MDACQGVCLSERIDNDTVLPVNGFGFEIGENNLLRGIAIFGFETETLSGLSVHTIELPSTLLRPRFAMGGRAATVGFFSVPRIRSSKVTSGGTAPHEVTELRNSTSDA